MGVVYEARDPNIDRIVAVKVLRQDRMDSETSVKRFMKEAKIVGRLSHPHIVIIYDVGEEQGSVYIAMEFIIGKSLDEILKEKSLNSSEVVAFGIQIAETLNYAHQKGVVHRDIKPSNIVVQTNGKIKITDFGIAHIDDASATLQTKAGEIMGTPAYMSPEQVMGKPVDGRCDIFSLGAILYELSTGIRPFGAKGKNLATVFNEIINVTPKDPFVAMSPVPQELSWIIMKALQKEPEKRFQTGRELAEALKNCLKESPQFATQISDAAKPKKSKFLSLTIAAVTVTTVACGVLFYSQSRILLSHYADTTNDAMPLETKRIDPVAQPDRVTSETNKPVQNPLEQVQNISSPTTHMAQPRSKQVQGKKTIKERSLPLKLQPVPALVALMMRTAPQGASVSVDGTIKGKTPLTLMLPIGKHRLVIMLSGYREIEKVITLEETMEYPLSFKLQAVAEPD